MSIRQPRTASSSAAEPNAIRQGAGASIRQATESPYQVVALLGGIGVLALLLRIASVAQTSTLPSITQLLGDAAAYFAWAQRIAAGDWYGDQTFYQAPLYPYVLAVLIKFGGLGVGGMRVVQALMGAIACVLVALTTRKIFGLRAGVAAGLMMALYAPAIYYDGIIQKTSLASFLLCSLMWSSLSLQFRPSSDSSEAPDASESANSGARKKSDYALSFFSGILLGLLVLTRENALLWIPLFLIWLARFVPSRTSRGRLVLAGLFTAGLAIVLVPVAARNASLGGEWSPTTFQAGPNFYIGNRAGASGIYEPLVSGQETPFYERTDAHRLAERESGEKLSAREVSRFWFEKSWSEIRQEPYRWITLLVRKTAMVLNHYEVPDVEGLFIYEQYSIVLKVLSAWHFGVLAPLAAIGIALTRQRWKELSLQYALIAVMIIAIVGFFVLGRYRFPLVPLLMPFAAVGVTLLYEHVRRRDWRPLALPLTVAGVVLAASYLPIHPQHELNGAVMMNQGVAAGARGDLGTAILLLEESQRMDNENAETHFNLGYAYKQSGQLQRALKHLVASVNLKPDLLVANYQLAQCLEQIGRLEDAKVIYEHMLDVDPGHVNALQALDRLERRSPAPQ